MIVKTITQEQVWQSPGGQKTIWNVTLDGGVKQYSLKTFDAAIATVGFAGEVESYVNQRGERFVKQVGKSDGTSAGGGDDRIKAQWAIGQAVQAVTFTPENESYMPAVEDLAKQFYTMVDKIQETT